MTAPWQRAKSWWEEHRDEPGSFGALVATYLQVGYVWSSPAEFILAAVVSIGPDGKVQRDPEGDTWFVHLSATDKPGDGWRAIRRFMQVAPHPLPFVAWHRGRSRLHRYEWEKLSARLEERG